MHLCKKFNIDLSKRSKHNALLDCELLREVYINLLDAKEPNLIFYLKIKMSLKLQTKKKNMIKQLLIYLKRNKKHKTIFKI